MHALYRYFVGMKAEWLSALSFMYTSFSLQLSRGGGSEELKVFSFTAHIRTLSGKLKLTSTGWVEQGLLPQTGVSAARAVGWCQRMNLLFKVLGRLSLSNGAIIILSDVYGQQFCKLLE